MGPPDMKDRQESDIRRGWEQAMEVTKSEASRASKLYNKFKQGREKNKEKTKAPPQARPSASRLTKADSTSIDVLSERNFGHVLSPRKNFERDLGKQFVLTPDQMRRVNGLDLRSRLTQKREEMTKKGVAARMEHLTPDHFKMLYLLHEYTGNSLGNNDWMRRQALQVLLYEGICMGVLEYDYAPICQQVDESMIYLNVSQDAADDLDDLREMLLIKTLLLTTYQHTMSTAVQLLPKGYECLQKLMNTELYATVKSEMDVVIYRNQQGGPASGCSPHYRLKVDFSRLEKSFIIYNDAGYRVRSGITDIENVSYVCSPYIPDCLRTGQSIIKTIPSNWDIGRELADALKPDEEIAETGAGAAKGNAGGRRLQELLKLGGIRACVAEWIPYGRNYLAFLNEKLGSGSKVPGGLFTSELDEEPDEEVFVTTQEQTGNCLYVMDYESSTYVNFVAEVFSAIDNHGSLKQVEQFGIHVHFDGTFFYSSVINSVMDRFYGDISFDYLTRVLVDIHQDSNVVSENLTTPYQYVMLDSVFGGNSSHRPKFNLIIAEEIDPWMSLEKYLDEEEVEMEIQQVIGEVRSAHELAPKVYLFIGKNGLLIIGDSGMILEHEQLLFQYVALRARELLMESYVSRAFQIGDVLQNIRQCIQGYLEDPGSLEKIRLLQSEAMHEIINLQEVLHHLEISLDSKSSLLGDFTSEPDPQPEFPKAGSSRFRTPGQQSWKGTMNRRNSYSLRADSDASLEVFAAKGQRACTNNLTPEQEILSQKISDEDEEEESSRVYKLPADSASDDPRHDESSGLERRLKQVLNVRELYQSLKLRCVDMHIHLKGNRSELDSLRHMTNYIGEQEAYRLQSQMQVNTRNLEDVFRANERSSSSLEIMQIILAGSLAFDILDRVATLYLSIEHGPFAEFIADQIVAIPFMWLLLNIVVWAGISWGLLKFMRFVAKKAMGVVTVRLTINIPIERVAMEKMLKSKHTQSENLEREETSQIVQCVYWDSSDVWGGETVKVDISYDTSNSYLLKAYIQVPRGSDGVNTTQVELAFFAELRRNGVIVERTDDHDHRRSFEEAITHSMPSASLHFRNRVIKPGTNPDEIPEEISLPGVPTLSPLDKKFGAPDSGTQKNGSFSWGSTMTRKRQSSSIDAITSLLPPPIPEESRSNGAGI